MLVILYCWMTLKQHGYLFASLPLCCLENMLDPIRICTIIFFMIFYYQPRNSFWKVCSFVSEICIPWCKTGIFYISNDPLEIDAKTASQFISTVGTLALSIYHLLLHFLLIYTSIQVSSPTKYCLRPTTIYLISLYSLSSWRWFVHI
jgi:hypothetical protein